MTNERIHIIDDRTPEPPPVPPPRKPEEVAREADQRRQRASIGEEQTSQRHQGGSRPDEATLKNQVQELEARVSRFTDRLGFELDTQRLVLEITDRDTGRILHRFPPEQVAELGERLEETASLVVDLYA